MIAATRGNQTFSLPNEVFDKIISFLDKKNIVLLFTINKVWYQYFSRNDLWAKFCTEAVVDNPREHFYLKHYFSHIIQKETFKASNLSIICLRVTENHIIACSLRSILIWDRSAFLNKKLTINDFVSIPIKTKRFTSMDINGENLVIINNSNDIFIKDFRGNDVHSWTAHKVPVMCIKASNGSIISGTKESICIWDSFGLLQKAFRDEHNVRYLEVIGKTIISGSDSTICIWNENSDSPIKILSDHKGDISCLKATNSRLVSGSFDKTIRIWDCKNYSLLNTLEGHKKCILCLEVFGDFIISGSLDKTMRIWDLDTGDLLHTYQLNSPIRRMQIWGNALFCGSDDGVVSVWTPERLGATIKSSDS